MYNNNIILFPNKSETNKKVIMFSTFNKSLTQSQGYIKIYISCEMMEKLNIKFGDRLRFGWNDLDNRIWYLLICEKDDDSGCQIAVSKLGDEASMGCITISSPFILESKERVCIEEEYFSIDEDGRLIILCTKPNFPNGKLLRNKKES